MKKNKYRIVKSIFLFIVLLFSVQYIYANEISKSDLDRKLQSNKKVKIGKLNNGLKYYLRTHKVPEKEVAFRLVVRAGSLQETDKQQGIAHFVEHMAFNGTKRFKKNDIINFFQKNGVQFGPSLNAFTSYNATWYKFKIIENSTKRISEGFDVLEDWMTAITFSPSEVEKEKPIIEEEKRFRDSVNNRINKQLLPGIFNNSRHVLRYPIGKMDIVRSLSADDLKKFYSDWYRPELMSIIIVGDISVDQIEKEIKKRFSKLKNKKDAPARVAHEIPQQKKYTFQTAEDSQYSSPAIWIDYKTRIIPFITEKDYRDYLVEDVYQKILYQRINSRRFAHQYFGPPRVSSYPLSDTIESRFIYAPLMTDFENAFVEIVEEIERINTFGVEAFEIKRESRRIIKQKQNRFDEKDTYKNVQIAEWYLNRILRKRIILSVEDDLKLAKKYLGSIKTEEIKAARAGFLKAPNKVISFAFNTDQKNKIPDKKKVDHILKTTRIQSKGVQSIDYDEIDFITKPLVPGTIIDEKHNQKIDMTVWELSNGARVILKPTDYKEKEILVRIYSKGGLSKVSKDDYYSALVAPSTLYNSGVGPFSRLDLNKKLAGKTIKLGYYMNRVEEGMSGSTTTEDLETLLQMIHCIIDKPSYGMLPFDYSKNNYINRMKNNMKNANWLAARTGKIRFYHYHYTVQNPTESDFASINGDTTQKILKERFQNVADFTFQFVGSFSLEEMRPLVEYYIGSLPKRGTRESVSDLNFTPYKGVTDQRGYTGNDPGKSWIRLRINEDVGYSITNAVHAVALQKVLTEKARLKLREEKGFLYTYQIWPQFMMEYSPHLVFNFLFSCHPDNVDKIIAELKSIIKDIKTKPITVDLLNEIKRTQIAQTEAAMKTNQLYANIIHLLMMGNQNPEDISILIDEIKKISAEDIRNYANKFLNEENWYQGVLNPKP